MTILEEIRELVQEKIGRDYDALSIAVLNALSTLCRQN